MAVAEMNGISFETVMIPEARKFSALNKSISNVVTVWGYDEESLDRAVLAREPIAIVRDGYVKRIDSFFQFKSLKDLEHVIVTGVQSPDYPKEILDHFEKFQHTERVFLLTGEDLYERTFQMISLNRADVAISTVGDLSYAIRSLGFADKLKVSPIPFYQDVFLYPGFSHKNPNAQALADMMTKGIRELRRTGRLKEILAAYGLNDWAASDNGN